MDAVRCPNHCEFIKDRNGCPICYCGTAAPKKQAKTCPTLNCKLECGTYLDLETKCEKCGC